MECNTRHLPGCCGVGCGTGRTGWTRVGRPWNGCTLRLGALLMDLRYSDGLMRVSVCDGAGNFGGMKGSAICLLSKLCLAAPLSPFELSFMFSCCCCSCCWSCKFLRDSLRISPIVAGKDSGRSNRGCPIKNNIQLRYKGKAFKFVRNTAVRNFIEKNH